jgi:hypothetical protein
LKKSMVDFVAGAAALPGPQYGEWNLSLRGAER